MLGAEDISGKNSVKEKTFYFDAEIAFQEGKLDRVPCEIIFPETQSERVIIKAKFINTGESLIPTIPFIFSLKAAISDSRGNLSKSIFAGKVYNLGLSTNLYDKNRSISVLKAEPVDLKICQFLGEVDGKKKNFSFWLTQSILLAPNSCPMLKHDGNITIHTSNIKSFEIIENLKFNFVNYYFHSKDTKRKNIRFSRSILTANFDGLTDQELGEVTLPDIDSFLKLVSFAERRQVVCYGYQGFSNGRSVEFYRGDIFIPEENFEHSFNEILIAEQDFQEFILQAFLNANKCKFRKHLFAGIGKIACRDYSLLESEYLSYYSALENLVNGYRDVHEFHKILDNNLWKEFSKDLKRFIKNHDFFKDEGDQDEKKSKNNKRRQICEKILELNRVSFGAAFKAFCDYYKVDLSDLWPLSGRENSTSLSKIRNRLIHGGRFKREEYEAVICARSHLEWTLERCILRVLDWDVERSRVCPTSLKFSVDYSEWKEKVNLLTND